MWIPTCRSSGNQSPCFIRGVATLAISAALARFCLGVASCMSCLVGGGRCPGATGPFPRRCDKCDTAEGWAFRRSVPSWSQAVASGGLRTGHGAFAISRNLKSTSPTGRWRPRRSLPLPLKFRLLPGLRLQLCLGPRYEGPSLVPRIAVASQGPIAKMPVCIDWRSSAKLPTQQGRPH